MKAKKRKTPKKSNCKEGPKPEGIGTKSESHGKASRNAKKGSSARKRRTAQVCNG